MPVLYPAAGFETFPASDADAYRGLARRWAASVTVVTVHRRAERAGDGAPRLDGFTATGFLTVSMAPPIVLVSASRASSALRMLEDAESFAVNLLAASQHALADRFATPHELRGDPFDDGLHAPDADGAPLLLGTLGAFSARLRQIVDAGDHALFLGDVTALHHGPPEAGLAYHNRRYVRMAHEP